MSNLSNNSNVVTVPSLSPAAMLQLIIPSNYLLISTGILALISNLLLIYVLYRQKREKTNFIWNVWQLALADAFLGFCAIYNGGKRQYDINMQKPQPKAECLVQIFFWQIAMAGCIAQTFCLSVDRLLAILMPKFYHHHLTGAKMQLINVSQWLFVIVFSIIGTSLFTQPVQFVASCTGPVVAQPAYLQAFIYLLAFYSAATVAIYIVILITVQVRIIKVRKANGNLNKTKKQMGTKLLASVGIIIVFDFITWLCSSIGAQVLTVAAGPQIAIIVVPYLPATIVLNGATNVVIYIWKNETIREDFVMVFWKNRVKNTGSEAKSGMKSASVWAETKVSPQK